MAVGAAEVGRAAVDSWWQLEVGVPTTLNPMDVDDVQLDATFDRLSRGRPASIGQLVGRTGRSGGRLAAPHRGLDASYQAAGCRLLSAETRAPETEGWMSLVTGVVPLVRAMSAAVARAHQPGSAGYEKFIGPSGPGRPGPDVVVEALSELDVAHAVRIATAHGAQVAVQCTGLGSHSAPPGGVLVATHALDTVIVRPATHTARIGAGARWEDVLVAAARHGLAPVCASSPRVGVVGHLVGGGHGPLARSWGLSSDRVLELDVVTGDGVIRRASSARHPGLYWGLRGGKATLGIVTAVELELVDQPEVFAGTLWFDEIDLPAVLAAWPRWARSLPEDATTSIAVIRASTGSPASPVLAGATTLAVRFALTGDPASGQARLAPLRAVAAPLVDTVALLPYAAIGSLHAEALPSGPISLRGLLLDDLDAAAAARLIELVGPGSACRQSVVEIRQLGGALGRPLRGPSAFSRRDARWSLQTVGPADDEVVADAARIASGLEPWTGPGALVNLSGGSDGQWARQVFEPDVIERLRDLSGRFDPAGTLAGGAWLRDN